MPKCFSKQRNPIFPPTAFPLLIHPNDMFNRKLFLSVYSLKILLFPLLPDH